MCAWIQIWGACFAVHTLLINTGKIQKFKSVRGYSDFIIGTAQLHGGVRIVDGSSASNGRVEVFITSQWSTVCDDLWDIRDADAVCRQLGYPRALAAASGNTFPMGNGSILLTGLQCVGNESSLLNCASQVTSPACNHMEDAGVYCFGGLKIEIYSYQLKCTC